MGAIRRSWGLKLQNSSSIGDLLEIMTQLEGAIKREFLSSDFETTSELLGALKESDRSVSQLPWIPQTTAAVSLRLLELDSSIFNTPNHKSEKHNATEVETLTKLSSRYRCIKDEKKAESTKLTEELTKSGNLVGFGTMHGSSKSRRVMRNHRSAHPSGRSKKSRRGSRTKSAYKGIKAKKTSIKVLIPRGERVHQVVKGCGHGPGTVGSQGNEAIEEMLPCHYDDPLQNEESPVNSGGQWVTAGIGKIQSEGPENRYDMADSESDG